VPLSKPARRGVREGKEASQMARQGSPDGQCRLARTRRHQLRTDHMREDVAADQRRLRPVGLISCSVLENRHW
jgi:hypothetical protein